MLEMELIEPETFEMELAGQIPSTIGGTTNYNELSGKPKINNVELKGNKTLEELGIDLDGTLQSAKDYADSIKPTKTSELTNDSDFAVTNQNNNFSTSQTVNGTLTVNGDIVQNGESYETHAEQVFTKNDEIVTRDGAVGGLSDGEYTGIQAIKYDGTNNGRLGFNASGEARVGDIGDEQPLLTRDELVNLQEGQVLVWDGTNLRAVGSSEFVKNTDYATTSSAGIAFFNSVSFIVVNGKVTLKNASETQIDNRQSYTPITSGNLDYAVKSVVGGHVTLTQAEYDELETIDENTYYNIVEE